MHFQVTTSVTRKWVVKGSEPKVKSAPSRKSVPYSGYIVPETGELIVSKPSWFNYETVIKSFRYFLQTYPIADGKRAYLILDILKDDKYFPKLHKGDMKSGPIMVKCRHDLV